jgi:hypothetical protein
MSIVTALRNRISTRELATAEPGDSRPAPVTDAGPPFPGYDRLRTRQVIDGLRDHSQIELEGVESYERSHQDREAVLDKLRWMRGSEPLPGYDALSVEEIVAALTEADLPTIKKVRSYERKFANRREVLDQVVLVLRGKSAAR